MLDKLSGIFCLKFWLKVIFFEKLCFFKQPFLNLFVFIKRTNDRLLIYKIKKNEKNRVIFSPNDHLVKL